MKNKIILVGDIHDDGGAVTALTQSLQALVTLGYKVLYTELSGGNDEALNKPEKLIKEYRLHLTLLDIFPKGIIPENLNDSQKNIISSCKKQKQYQSLKNNLDMNAKRSIWLEACIKLFEKVIELKINLVAIDVNEPSKYDRPSGIGDRNQYMFNEIKKSSQDGIILTGVAHIINTWERGRYNKGLLHHFLKDESYEISGAYFPYFHSDNASVIEAIKRLALCNEKSISLVQNIHIQNLETDLIQVKEFPLTSHNNTQFEKSTSELIKYSIPKIDKFNDILYYLNDLGAKIVGQNDQFIFCQMASHLLNKERRILLGMDRVKIPLLNKEGEDLLEKEVTGITIERLKSEEKLLLTFFVNPKKYNRHKINEIIKAHELQNISDKKNSLVDNGMHLLPNITRTQSVQTIFAPRNEINKNESEATNSPL